MGEARRAYEHYRWAERYSRRGRDDKAGAPLKRALHYGLNGLNGLSGLSGLNGLSGFGGVKRALDTGDAGHLTTQEALVEAYEGSKAENRLGFLRSLCSAEFRRFFYDKHSEYNRISETQKALFKAKIAELRIGDEQESASIVRCLTALVDSLRLVPFSEFCTALAPLHCGDVHQSARGGASGIGEEGQAARGGEQYWCAGYTGCRPNEEVERVDPAAAVRDAHRGPRA
jgi:hypothetical protein